jgi:hypothetical protein
MIDQKAFLIFSATADSSAAEGFSLGLEKLISPIEFIGTR